MPSRESRNNPFRHIHGAIQALPDADRLFYYYTRVPLTWEYTDIAADGTDATDKFAVEVACKGSSDAGFTVISTTAANATADAVASTETADSTSPLNNTIPAGSTIRITVDESGTGTNVVGASFDVAFSYAR
jgi:hypothetical protein